jgi:hypothetical protein
MSPQLSPNLDGMNPDPILAHYIFITNFYITPIYIVPTRKFSLQVFRLNIYIYTACTFYSVYATYPANIILLNSSQKYFVLSKSVKLFEI